MVAASMCLERSNRASINVYGVIHVRCRHGVSNNPEHPSNALATTQQNMLLCSKLIRKPLTFFKYLRRSIFDLKSCSLGLSFRVLIICFHFRSSQSPIRAVRPVSWDCACPEAAWEERSNRCQTDGCTRGWRRGARLPGLPLWVHAVGVFI